MNLRNWTVCAAGALLWLSAAIPLTAAEPVPAAKNIDIAICLDVSNSMDGLIGSAKAKLWDIVNDLAKVKPTPNLRVALFSSGNDGYDPTLGWVRNSLPFPHPLPPLDPNLFP